MMVRKSAELPQYHSQSPPLPTPPESIKDFRSDSSTLGDDVDERVVRAYTTCQSRQISAREYALDWAVKCLGVLTAVLFGIWAPVSYHAQTTGNASQDIAQNQLVDKVERLGEEIESLKERVSWEGVLRAWEYCEGHSQSVSASLVRLAIQWLMQDMETLSACHSLSKTVQINSVIQTLASTYKKHKPSSRRTPSFPKSEEPTTPKTAATLISAPTSIITILTSNSDTNSVVSRATEGSSPAQCIATNTAIPVASSFSKSLESSTESFPTQPSYPDQELQKALGQAVGNPFSSAVLLGFMFGIVLACLMGVVLGWKSGIGKRKSWKDDRVEGYGEGHD